jgi:hypothetical protein
MPSRALRHLWVRSAAAAAASILALASTASLVAAAVVAPAGSAAPVLSGPSTAIKHVTATPSPSPNTTVVGTGDGKGVRDGTGKGKSTGGIVVGTVSGVITTHPGPTVAAIVSTLAGSTDPASNGHGKPPAQPVTAASAAVAHAAPRTVATTASAPLVHVVVDAPDPAPFAPVSIAAVDVSAQVFPSERLGPLSGISFGVGLLAWPVLLAINFLALGAIARMALRRRLTSPED